MVSVHSVMIAVASACAIASSAGASSGRRVQIIVMNEEQVPAVSADAAQTAVDVGEDFRLNNLRRFFDLTAADASHGAPAEINEDPFEQQDRPFLGGSPVVSAGRSAILVPLWMQPRPGFVRTLSVHSAGCAPSSYRPSGLLSLNAEGRRKSYYALMADIACEQGVPVSLFDALIMAESGYDATALSPKSAYGLTQLMPATAAALGVDRFDVTSNLRGGARYLRSQINRFGQYHLALAAYNAGPGRVKNGRIPNISETQAYVSRIIRNWGQIGLVQQPDEGRPARLNRRAVAVANYKS